jgi:hypothetical protein
LPIGKLVAPTTMAQPAMTGREISLWMVDTLFLRDW